MLPGGRGAASIVTPPTPSRTRSPKPRWCCSPILPDAETYVRGIGQTDANDFLLAALDAGVVIVAEGAAAESLGQQIAAVDGQSGAPGLGWIPGAIIQTHFSEDAD